MERKHSVIFVLLMIWAVMLNRAYAGVPTLAVLDFQNNSFFGAEELHSLQPGLADMMITALSQVSGLKVVERRQYVGK